MATLVATALVGCIPTATPGQGGDPDVRIGASTPLRWDPAAAGDAGSGNTLAQVFEGLTAFDVNSNVQPALADSWLASDDGRQITFHLRPGIRYSDGSAIVAQDVVDSWLRLIDPDAPSPLASLLDDVVGASDYRRGAGDSSIVGLHAEGENVVVDLRRPATYFISVTASPSLAVVPPSMYGRLNAEPPADIVVSGAYVPSLPSPEYIRLTGNPNYWAGLPRWTWWTW